MECARVLWTKRAYHKTGGLSTQRAEISGNPHIKSSRGLIRFSSRDTHNISENLVDIYHHSHKVQSRLSSSFNTLISIEITESSRDGHLVETGIQSRCVHILTYLTHALDSCILDVYTSRYIMHKRVYTVTLDIECWDDLKVEKIDWAKSINLFPDEFIHSSVQERTSPRPVDRT